MDKIYDAIFFISNIVILRRYREANFADILKIATMFIKTSFKDSKKLNFALKCNAYMYFLI